LKDSILLIVLFKKLFKKHKLNHIKLLFWHVH